MSSEAGIASRIILYATSVYSNLESFAVAFGEKIGKLKRTIWSLFKSLI